MGGGRAPDDPLADLENMTINQINNLEPDLRYAASAASV